MAAGTVTFGAVWSCSYMSDPDLFIYSYALVFGFGKGIMYSLALHVAISHLPGRKGVVSGFVICGFGFGGFFFGLICNQLCNPNDLRPVTTLTPYGEEELFGEEVAVLVPGMLRKMCLVWIALWLFSLCTISQYSHQATDDSYGTDSSSQSSTDLKQAMESELESRAEA